MLWKGDFIKVMKRLQQIHMLLLVILSLIGFWSVITYLGIHGYIYGSDVDWLSQHITIADLIRKNFYETGQIIGNYTNQLASGMNTAQLMYYGIGRPEVLLSFLFPMIEMKDIFISTSILWFICSVLLCYDWLFKENIHPTICFIGSCLFALSGPMLFHTHRHMMFINYMPFLFLTLKGIRIYLKNRKSRWLIIGVAGMVLESYYFSVTALITCGLYAIYCVLRNQDKFQWNLLVNELLKLLFHVCIGLGISACILIPTAFSMLGNHREAIQSPTLLELLKPQLDMSAIVYTSVSNASYSVGLGMIAYVCILYFLYKNKKECKVLGILVFLLVTIPIFCYILNGMQYIRQKSLIPLLPIIIYMIAYMLHDIYHHKMKKSIYVLFPFSFIPIYFMTTQKQQRYCFIDVIILLSILLIYMKRRKPRIMLLYLIVPLIMAYPINQKETFLKKSKYEAYKNEDKISLVSDIIHNDIGMYRFDDLDQSSWNSVFDVHMKKTSSYSSNNIEDYVSFYNDIMRMPSNAITRVNMSAVNQPFFNRLMSVKYMISKNEFTSYGYHEVQHKQSYKVWKNEHVFPIAYASSNLIGMKEFQKLSYPYTMDAIYHQVVVNEDVNNTYTSHLTHLNLSYDILSKEDVSIQKVENGYRVKAGKKGKVKVKLTQPLKNELLIIHMGIQDVKNEKNNVVKIAINGNVQSRANTGHLYANHKNEFDYVLSSNQDLETIDVTFSKGEYTITNINTYVMNNQQLDKVLDQIDEVDFIHDDDAVLSGKINVSNDGYLVTSLPYQKGFQVEIDGKKVAYEKVNTAFVGAKIQKGEHNIRIIYQMPGKYIGILTSILSCVLGSFLFIYKRKRMKKGIGV